MDYGLNGKKALVTGSTAGIGFATARALAGEGAHITLNGRTARRLDSAAKKIRDEFPDAVVEGIAANLGTADGCRDRISRLPEVDILVNNLGNFRT